jgi:hypothetical protein
LRLQQLATRALAVAAGARGPAERCRHPGSLLRTSVHGLLPPLLLLRGLIQILAACVGPGTLPGISLRASLCPGVFI